MGNAESTGSAATEQQGGEHHDADDAREPDAYNDVEVYSSSSSSSSGDYEDDDDESGSSSEDDDDFEGEEDEHNGIGGEGESGEEGSSHDGNDAAIANGVSASAAFADETRGERHRRDEKNDADEVFPLPFRVNADSTERLRSVLVRLSPLTRADLLDADAILRAERRRSAASGSAVSLDSAASDDSSFDILEEHVDAATFLLGISSEINELRFKLVPARLSEGRFWMAVFRLIRRGREEPPPPRGTEGEEVEASAKDQGERDAEGTPAKKRDPPLQRYMTRRAQAQTTGVSQAVPATSSLQQQQQKMPASPSSRAHSFSPATYSQEGPGIGGGGGGGGEDRDSLRRHLRVRDDEIARLRRGLEEARATIELLEASSTSNRPASDTATAAAQAQPTDVSTALPLHKGKWEMDRDSADFLALDDELRSNLRREKAKRLEEVRRQMRFILDTDDVSASHGKWGCCGHEEYLGGDGCGGS